MFNSTTGALTSVDLTDNQIQALANDLRADAIDVCVRAQSGHIGASTGAAELFATLYCGGVLRLSVTDPRDRRRDRVLVRGHMGPLRYSLFARFGWVEREELWTYGVLGSRLQGHEEHQTLPGVDITPSGSLGMLLSFGAGAALTQVESEDPFHTWVFLGDGEEQEGNVSEAARHIAAIRLRNLTVVIDKNGAQLSTRTEFVDKTNLSAAWSGYGWRVLEVDGHSVPALRHAFKIAKDSPLPCVLIAHTSKGRGLPGHTEHQSGYHTFSVTPAAVLESAMRHRNTRASEFQLAAPSRTRGPTHADISRRHLAPIEPGPTTPIHLDDAQLEYFLALAAQWRREEHGTFYFLTADTTLEDAVKAIGLHAFARYYNVGVREQHMTGLAHGISCTDPRATVLLNTIDAFALRAADQLSALIRGGGRCVIIGDVAGLSNARNGATHQSVDQPRALLGLRDLVFIEPADVTDLFRGLTRAIANAENKSFYLRVHSSTPVAPIPVSAIRSDRAYVVTDPERECDLTVIASGLMVGYCLEAIVMLRNDRIRLINVVQLSDIGPEVAQFVQPGRPMLVCYNGDPATLAQPICEQMIRQGILPSRLDEAGFTLGTSGSMPQLLSHLGLDGKGLARRMASLLS